MNDYAQSIIDKEKKERTGWLDLGNCGLTGIPLEVWTEMPWLEWLCLANEWLDWNPGRKINSANSGEKNILSTLPPTDPELPQLRTLVLAGTWNEKWPLADLGPLKDLLGLNSLFLTHTQVSDLSPLKDLQGLNSLDLWGTQVGDLGPLKDLQSLNSLDLSGTQVSDLGPLKELKNLNSLFFSRTQVTDLGPLKELKNLNSLIFADTQVSDLGPLKELRSLNSLNLLQTQVNDLAPLKELQNLNSLDLTGTPVSDFRPLKDLQSLNSLYLQNTQLSDLRPLKELQNLNSLNLWNTPVSDLGPLKELQSLHSLYLKGTPVSDLGPLKELQNLNWLDLTDTQVSDLRPILPLLKRADSHIRLDAENMVNPPPAIAAQGKEAILAYFEEQEQLKGKFKPLYEAKVLVVGEGESGKTSLINRIYGKDLPEKKDTTRGIEVQRQPFLHPENGEEVMLNVWDFGGQDIYYSIHQLFLTERSLYVLVDSTRNSGHGLEDPIFRYWLEVIELLGGGSPLLIFQNEIGQRPKSLAINEIKGEFPQVKEGFAGDLKEAPKCVASIFERIKAEVLQLPQFQEKYPPYLQTVRDRLEERAVEVAHIPWTEFFEIYQEEATVAGAEPSEEYARFLAGTLHNLGIILHFHQERPKVSGEGEVMDEVLGRLVILRNQWATDAIYRLLDDPEVSAQNGRFTMKDCENVWSDQNYRGHVPELLHLMLRFELCYQLKDVKPDTWLLPSRLQEDRPAEMKEWGQPDGSDGWLELRFEYEFLPRGMVNRLMVRNHRFVPRPELSWKNGCLFEFPPENSNEAQLLVHTKGAKTIRFRARGRDASKLIELIAWDLEGIHRKIPKLSERVKKMVPCICAHCRVAEDRDRSFYEYEELQKRKRSGMAEMMFVACFKGPDIVKVSVSKLLEGIEIRDRKEEMMEEMLGHTRIIREDVEFIRNQTIEIKGLLGITNLRLNDLKLDQEEIAEWRDMLLDIEDNQLSREDVMELVAAFDADFKDLPQEVLRLIQEADREAKENDDKFLGPITVRLSLPFLADGLSVSTQIDLQKFNKWVDRRAERLPNIPWPRRLRGRKGREALPAVEPPEEG